MKPTISKPFKSNDRTFDKVYDTFDKRDYFNSQGLAKTQIGNFERALKKNDKGAQQVLDLFKGDEKKAKDYITQVVSDRNKERAFNNYKAMKDAVDSIQKGKPNVGAVDYVKRIIHNSSQKYSITLYSALRNKKFTKWKDVHDDIDSLVKEGFSSDAQRKAAFANGYEEKDKKNEGKKRFKRQDGIGKAKYTISFHDGKKKHKDGSDFFDIKIFKNKKDLSDFVGTLVKQGYKLTRESVNEAIGMSQSDRNKIYHKLNKGDKVRIKFGNAIRKRNEGEFIVSKGKTKVGKQRVERITLKNVKNPSGVKYYLYNRNNNIGMAQGDMGAVIEDMEIVKESVNEAKKTDQWTLDVIDHLEYLKYPKKDIDYIMDFEKKKIKGWKRKKVNPTSVGQQLNIILKKLRRNEGISVSDERHFGKKGIIIMIDDNGKKVSAIFKDKKNADKFNRNKSSDIQKLLQLAKKTKYPKAIDESMNEAGKLAMGIAALTGTRGSAVQDFIDKNRINDKKLFKALKKANLQGRINFASALAGRPGNPNEKLTIKLFGESKKEVIALRKKAKSEKAFYDVLDKIERKYGRGVFEKWLDKSLKDLKLNPKKYKTPADKQEALYQAKL